MLGRRRLQSYRIKQFTGGRNTVASDYDLDPSQSANDLNIDLRKPGSIRKRNGYRRFIPVELGVDPITGLYRYYKRNGDRHILALCGSVLWQGEGDAPVMHQIKDDFTAGTFLTFATMQDWCYMANYSDACQRYDGTTIRAVGLDAPANPESGTTYFQEDLGGATGRITGGAVVYAIIADYGPLGLSNMAVGYTLGGVLTETTVAGRSYRIHAAQSLLPTGAVRLKLYRSLSGAAPPDSGTVITWPDDAFEYVLNQVPMYFVGDMDGTDTYSGVDTYYYDMAEGDAELLSQYGGDTYDVPKARYLAEHNNRLWYGHVYLDGETNPGPEFPSRIYWSDLYQPDRVTGFVDVQPEDGDAITGIVSLQNNLVVFKNNRTYLVLGFSERDFQVRLVNGNVGCIAPRSIAIMDNRVYFLATDGVWAFDGAGFERVSDMIREDIVNLPQAGRNFAAGGVWKGRYYLSVMEDE